MKNKIKNLRENLLKKLEKAQKKCIDESFIRSEDTIEPNPKHFKYCEADLINKQLELLDKL